MFFGEKNFGGGSLVTNIWLYIYHQDISVVANLGINLPR